MKSWKKRCSREKKKKLKGLMCVDRGTVSKGAAYSVKLRLPDDHDIKFSFEIGSFPD